MAGKTKQPKKEVAYKDEASGDVCQDCQHFVSPRSCSKVLGKISPEGTCDLFSKDSAWGERSEELCDKEAIREQVLDLMKTVSSAFRGQWERGNDQLDWWECYNCTLGGHQSYAGNNQIYVPLIKMAVDARRTRFVNQMFPRTGRNVDVITSEDKPWQLMALLEHYIRKTKLRTRIVPALCKNGDVEGQYNLGVTWADTTRHIAFKQPGTVEIEEGVEYEDDDPDEYEVVEEEIFTQAPIVEVLADLDVVVFPVTAKSIDDAVAQGGGVAVIRRWTKEKLRQMIDDGEIDEEAGELLIEQMKKETDDPNTPDVTKKHADAAGITLQEGMKVLIGYEVWSVIKRKDEKRLCRIYWAGGEKDTILSVKRNPYWCDKVPVLSAPQDAVATVFKGMSPVKFVADLQYAANDAVNMGWDSAAYAMMPIVMTDPSKNPRVGSMVLNLAAIWETSPNDTKFAQFPALWKDALSLVGQNKQEVFQALSVTPAMIAQSTGGKSQKRNQAEIAAEQQAELLSTADAVTNIEDEMLSPLMRWFVDLDHQYRDRDLTVRQYGELGIKVNMIEVPPINNSTRYEVRWWGVEAMKSAQAMQQQIAAINVVKGIPPQQMPGYKLNLVPVIQLLIENTFGARLAPQIFQSMKEKLSMAPDMENDMLILGLALPVHELDDDKQHMEEHMKAMQASHGDPTGAIRMHVMAHRQQMQQKLQMEQQGMAAMMQGAQGGPGGAGPGVSGTPRPGAQPGQGRPGQQPPGAVHQDRMIGTQAPRR
jgi:hypothetical protein